MALTRDVFSRSTFITDWVAYTPSNTAGLGTLSGLTLESRRVGDTLEIRGYFTTGTVTATQAQLSLGYNGISGNVVADSIKVASGTQEVGYCTRNISNTDQYYITCTAGQAFVTFGIKSSTNSYPTTQNGNALFGSSETLVHIQAWIPINGWSANQ